MTRPHVAVLGAGSIGCYVGGAWAAAGVPVTFIGRNRLAGDLAEHGLTLTDYDGWSERIAPDALNYRTDPAALKDADIILLTVKSGATAAAAAEIERYAKRGAAVVSLQNGLGNVRMLEQAFGGRRPVVWAIVPFNVAFLGEGRFHKGVAGHLVAEDCAAVRPLADAIAASREPLRLSRHMASVAWGKLLINLNNAVNALSGLPLVEQLAIRDFRRVVAASQREALATLRAAGIRPAKIGPVPPRLLPRVIASPDWLFRNFFARGWKIDAKARSSMADDLAEGRRTEIEWLNGEIVRLAERTGREAPVNRRIVELVHRAEEGAKPWAPAALAADVLSRR